MERPRISKTHAPLRAQGRGTDVSEGQLLLARDKKEVSIVAMKEAEELAKRFHEAYEELAPAFSYETRKDSAVPWDAVPQQNRRLMIAVCRRLLDEGI